MGKSRRRKVSLGTILMLLLTALVVIGCILFFALLVGDDLYERTGEFIRSLSEQGLFDMVSMPQSEQPAPSAASYLWLEDTPVPTVPPATPTPVPAPSTITIAVAGTVYAPKAIRESGLSGSHYDFDAVFAGLGDTLSDADLAIATLETTTAGRDKGFDNYNTAPEILDALRASGVDLLALATERALDKGYEGLELTISELTARGLAYAGVQREGMPGATMMRIGGIQVAVLAYSYGLSDEGAQATNGDERAMLALMDQQKMISDIRQARVSGANVVIVLPHWGMKNIAEIPVNVHRLSKELAQAGADIILGTHPNVPQSTERIRTMRADGLEYETVVCYSLGCLLTDARTPENTAGMIAHVSVTHDPVTRRTTLGEMYCTPVYVARQRAEEKTVYRVVDAESAQALEGLTQEEREAAQQAVERIREATQTDGQEGHG